jgi:outer membrane protein assembly factor BamD (BamD/ComL family)
MTELLVLWLLFSPSKKDLEKIKYEKAQAEYMQTKQAEEEGKSCLKMIYADMAKMSPKEAAAYEKRMTRIHGTPHGYDFYGCW